MSASHPHREFQANPGTDEFMAEYRRLKRKEARHNFAVMTLLTMSCYLVVAAAVFMLLILAAQGRI